MPPHVYPLTHRSCKNSRVHDVDVEMNSNKAPPFLLSFIREYRRFGGNTHPRNDGVMVQEDEWGEGEKPVVTVQVELWINRDFNNEPRTNRDMWP